MDLLDSIPTWVLGPAFLLVPIALIAWLILRNPERTRLSAEAAGRALSLAERPAPHPRMKVFGGNVMDFRAEVASEANFMAIYQPIPFTHAYGSGMVVRVYFQKPLSVPFRIDSSRGAEGNVDAREHGLHWIYKAWTSAPERFGQLLQPAPVREAVLGLFGKTPEGSGRIVRLDEQGVYVHYAEPKPELAAELAQAMVRAAHLLVQRDAFLPGAASPASPAGHE